MGAGRAVYLGQERVELALELLSRIRPPREKGRLVSLGLALAAEVDPVALAFASRREGEELFCFAQPERSLALGALGVAARVEGEGASRFLECARRWEALAGEAAVVSVDRGAEEPLPFLVGGFAFDRQGARSAPWQGFGPASLTVPNLLFAKLPSAPPLLALSAWVAAGQRPLEVLAPLVDRIAALREKPLGLLDPFPSLRPRVEGALAPQHFEAAVEGAKALIAAGSVRKLVVAREVLVHSAKPFAPASLFGALREGFPACTCFCVLRGGGAFVGASPELLVRREGQRLTTVALAGSARRSADPAVDAHLGERLLHSKSQREEHGIVVERIVQELEGRTLWVTAAQEPQLVRVANIQHLATPVRAQLAAPRSVLELAGWLHPTPAVGGEPKEEALILIPRLEGFDRGWYTGPLGYCNAAGEGELCVALRCALLRGGTARCFAGNGIVRESDPAAELAETEVKLGALLPLLAP